MAQRSSITRRSFIAGAGATLATAGAIAATASASNAQESASSEAGSAATSEDANADSEGQVHDRRTINMDNVNPIETVSEPDAYDYETDILIIGYGVGGTSAGLTAVNNGAKVIAMEKSFAETWYEHAGVHSVIVFGEPSWLEREGIPAWNDEVIDGIVDTYQQTYPYFSDNDRAAVKAILSNDMPAFEQIEAVGKGCQFKWVELFPHSKHDPSMVPLNDNIEGGDEYYPWVNKYHGVENRIREYSEDKGLQVLWGTPATNLIVDDTGKVVGAKGKSRSDDSDVFVKATCTIIATGGYGANYDMVQYYGVLDEMAGCHVGPITNTGDGQRMAEGAGCQVRGLPRWTATASESGIDAKSLGLPWTLAHDNAVTQDAGLSVGRQLSAYYYAPVNIARQSCLKVNKRGQRFMNEAGSWWMRIWNEFEQPNHSYYAIYDGNIESVVEKTNQRYAMCEYMITPDRYVYFNDDDIRPMYNWQDEFQDGLDKGYIVEADTLEELADKLGINKATFLQTVEDYNALIEAGEDTEYGAPLDEMFPIKDPPFYGMCRKACFLWQCEGGVATDPQGRVINETGEVIPGLYCGSNEAAVTDFDAYNNQMMPTAGGATFAFTMGYIAANSAIAELNGTLEEPAGGYQTSVPAIGMSGEPIPVPEDVESKCGLCHSVPEPCNIAPMTEEEGESFLSTHGGGLDGDGLDDAMEYFFPSSE